MVECYQRTAPFDELFYRLDTFLPDSALIFCWGGVFSESILRFVANDHVGGIIGQYENVNILVQVTGL